MTELASLDLEKHGLLDISCVVNGPIQTNTYFAISEGEAAVIDPAWDGERLARDFQAAHPDAAIKAIICTHGHADHIGGVAGMRRVLGDDVPFLISKADAAFMAPAIESMKAMWGFEFEMPPAADRLLREGDTVEFGDVSLQVFATPGHTPGGLVLFCAAQTGDVAFVGDTLFPGAHGRTDLEGGDEAAVIRLLGKMARLMPDDTLCLIGHNETTVIGREKAENLFMRRGMRYFK